MENKRISQFQILFASLKNFNIICNSTNTIGNIFFLLIGEAIHDSSLVQDDLQDLYLASVVFHQMN